MTYGRRATGLAWRNGGEEDFGPLLKRLLDRRGLDPADLSRLASTPEPELLPVLHGETPSPSLLRRLAPVLGLHTADLFAIAGADIPDDLAPLDPTAGRRVPHLARAAVALPPERRNALRRLVASLPQNAADAAELIWDVRRLTASQLQQVADTAEAMRKALPSG